ncbi:uncharacterized protein LOC144728688 isoform X1 [Lampetra planeri]
MPYEDFEPASYSTVMLRYSATWNVLACDSNATLCEGTSCLEPVESNNKVLNFTLSIVLTLMLALVMFAMGCTVQIHKVIVHLRNPWGIIIGFVCQFGFMPLTAFALAIAFKIEPIQAIAVLIMGCCPGGTTSNIITYWLDGDMDLSISMTVCSTLLGMGMMPLCLFIYTQTWTDSASIAIPYDSIGITLVSLVVPVAFGMFVQYKWPKKAKILVKRFTSFSSPMRRSAPQSGASSSSPSPWPGRCSTRGPGTPNPPCGSSASSSPSSATCSASVSPSSSTSPGRGAARSPWRPGPRTASCAPPSSSCPSLPSSSCACSHSRSSTAPSRWPPPSSSWRSIRFTSANSRRRLLWRRQTALPEWRRTTAHTTHMRTQAASSNTGRSPALLYRCCVKGGGGRGRRTWHRPHVSVGPMPLHSAIWRDVRRFGPPPCWGATSGTEKNYQKIEEAQKLSL